MGTPDLCSGLSPPRETHPMNQAQRHAELNRLEQERRESMRLFSEGKVTEEAYKAQLQALSGRTMRLMIEVKKAQNRRNGEE